MDFAPSKIHGKSLYRKAPGTAALVPARSSGGQVRESKRQDLGPGDAARPPGPSGLAAVPLGFLMH